VEGKKLTNGMEIPGIGKVVIEGEVIKVNAMIDITAENADSYGF